MKPSILIQLDTDPQPSVFDGVVAVDAGVEQLFRHGGVCPEQVRELVFGAIFTRGGDDLKRTAIFVGGSDVEAGEAVLKTVVDSFVGPLRVSVLLDSNGANTTAAAAVLAARQGMGGGLEGVRASVLGGTGPVGQRVARLLAREGADVAIGSRKLERAQAVARTVGAALGKTLSPFASEPTEALAKALDSSPVIVSAGAAGATLLPKSVRENLSKLKVAIDLNAVPPTGIEGVEPSDRGTQREGVQCWGALGIGGAKMKIHKTAIQELFKTNDHVLDAESVYAIGLDLGLG